MTDPDAVSRSPSSIGIGFNGWDLVDAYKVYIDPNPDLATNAIDNSPTRESLAVHKRVPERVKKPPVIADEKTKCFW
jgi:hypothetical protein